MHTCAIIIRSEKISSGRKRKRNRKRRTFDDMGHVTKEKIKAIRREVMVMVCDAKTSCSKSIFWFKEARIIEETHSYIQWTKYALRANKRMFVTFTTSSNNYMGRRCQKDGPERWWRTLDFLFSMWNAIWNCGKSFFYTRKYALSDMVQECINEKLAEFIKVVPPHLGRTKTNASRHGTFLKRKGHPSGEIRIVKGWNGIGQAVSHLFQLGLTINITVF